MCWTLTRFKPCGYFFLFLSAKNNLVVDKIMMVTMENTSIEATYMPGHCVTYVVTSIFSANTRSERQSFQSLHLF